jgi:hypothetical protein
LETRLFANRRHGKMFIITNPSWNIAKNQSSGNLIAANMKIIKTATNTVSWKRRNA